MGNKKINIGFIGCGRVADNHFLATEKCSEAKLVVIGDTNKNLTKEKSKLWNVDSFPPEEICKLKNLDAVFVLTPVEYHYKYAISALNNGKHVLIEKPVSFNLQEIEKLIKASKDSDLICMPGHSYLYLPELQRFNEYLKNNTIGKPLSMFMSEIYYMKKDLAIKYHGPTREVLCHALYLMIAFLGMPEKVHAFSSCFRPEIITTNDEQILVNVKFKNKALASIFISWAGEDETTEPWTFKIKVLGTDGGLHFSRRDVVNRVKNNYPSWNYPLYDRMFINEVEYFINNCIIKKQKPLSTLKDAYKSIKILNKIIASLEKGEEQII